MGGKEEIPRLGGYIMRFSPDTVMNGENSCLSTVMNGGNQRKQVAFSSRFPRYEWGKHTVMNGGKSAVNPVMNGGGSVQNTVMNGGKYRHEWGESSGRCCLAHAATYP